MIAPSKPRTSIRLALVVLTTLLSVACTRAPTGDHVIVILLDAARSDRFSAYGYERETTPNMDALARRGAILGHHYTQGVHTRASLPTMMYSRYFSPPLFPASERVPLADPTDLFRVRDPQSVSLAQAFSAAGFRTALISGHVWIQPGTPFADQFDEVQNLSYGVDYPTGETVVDATLEWIEKHRSDDFLLFVHLMDTHFPHPFGDDARSLLDAASLREIEQGVEFPTLTRGGLPRPGASEPLTRLERAYLDALYDGSLKYADRQLGRLFDFLGEDLDHTLIAITSDHGESLWEQPGRFSHNGHWLEPIARIPLLISFPEKLSGPLETDSFSESVDLLPTLLALAEIEAPPKARFDGVDLVPYLTGALPPREEAFMRGAVRVGNLKASFDQPGAVLLADEPPDVAALSGVLFDLAADPGESENLFSTRADLLQPLLDRYRSKMREPFERYSAAATDRPPAERFAISVSSWRDFYQLPEVPLFGLRRVKDQGSWRRTDQTELGAFLIGDPSAPGLTVSFPVPDGKYRISGSFQGEATVVVQGDDAARQVSAQPQRDVAPEYAFTHVALGEIEVQDQRFSATVTPANASRVLVQYFGFEPLDAPSAGATPRSEAEQEDFEEQLRALGYIED